MLKQLCLGSMSRRSSALLLAALCGCGPLADTDEDAESLAQESAVDGGGTRIGQDGGGSTRFPSFDGGFPSRSRDAAVDAGPPNEVVLTNADGATIGRVTASGRGCPLGSWDVKMGEDQLTYTATFTALDIALSATQEVSSLSCTLSIAPPSDGSRQFSAQSVRYAAEGDFDEGVVGALEVRHFYQGSAANTIPAHVHEVGPFEGTLAIERRIETREARWTPCATPQRGVNVDLLLRLSNGFPRATGTLRGGADAKLAITLMSRACPQRVEIEPDAGL